ncbi:MAG: flagellar motor switch protein FliN [Maricaulis sp.]|jgi:flagellar motor switch protein FliN/FliY|nr:flagellar motor switch protein FliN [Maricaulis sp.]HAQ36314.1 flagellar motor switch protein FliN [Alphaproteobacteria bacterium]|tara:strand:+ start:35 stop:409 length:375 start_codon:yes stop_codon:yes gene_type:complete
MADDKDLDLPEFSGGASEDTASVPAPQNNSLVETLADEDEKTAVDLEPVFDVPVNVSAVLGKVNLDVHSLLKLKAGSVVELDRKVGEAIDIYVNNRLVARGEVVVVDERLGVTMTEIIKDGDSN